MRATDVYLIVEQLTEKLHEQAEEAEISPLLLWLMVKQQADFQLRKISDEDL